MIVKFGTDGVRGVANVELTPEINMKKLPPIRKSGIFALWKRII